MWSKSRCYQEKPYVLVSVSSVPNVSTQATNSISIFACGMPVHSSLCSLTRDLRSAEKSPRARSREKGSHVSALRMARASPLESGSSFADRVGRDSPTEDDAGRRRLARGTKTSRAFRLAADRKRNDKSSGHRHLYPYRANNITSIGNCFAS